VLGVDSRQQGDQYHVYKNTGDPDKIAEANRLTIDWIVEAQERGVGEVVLNCMNRDGVRQGYDCTQLRIVRESITVPLVASGGAGERQHFAEVFRAANVDGALAASVFHSANIHIADLKQYLATQSIDIRL
jgi:cyclase